MSEKYVTDAERANWDGAASHIDAIKYGNRANATIAALLLELERNHISKHQQDPNYEDSHKCASRLCKLAAEVRGTK